MNNLKEEFQEVKKLNEELQSTDNIERREKLIREIKEKVSNLENIVDENSNGFTNELVKIDDSINKLRSELREEEDKYNASYNRLKDMYNKRMEELSKGELTASEFELLKNNYDSMMSGISDEADTIKKNIDVCNKELTALKRKRNKINKDSKASLALGISYEEYKDIDSVLAKRKIFDAILEKKGLEDIINTPANKRSKEDKELLRKSREDIRKEIVSLKDNIKKDISVLDSIDLLYDLDTKMLIKNKSKKTKISDSEMNNITNKIEREPAKIKSNEKVVQLDPLKAPEDMKDVLNSIGSVVLRPNDYGLSKESYDDIVSEGYTPGTDDFDRVAIEYGGHALSDENKDVLNDLATESNANDIVGDNTLEWAPGYTKEQIDDAKANGIHEPHGPEYEQWLRETTPLGKKEVDNNINTPNDSSNINNIDTDTKDDENVNTTSLVPDGEVKDLSENTNNNINNNIDKWTLFYNTDNDEYYARDSLFDRFNDAKKIGDQVRINGSLCHGIDESSAKKIIDNKDNNVSPYDIDIVNINNKDIDRLNKIDKVESEKLGVEGIIDKLTNGLEDIAPSDIKKFKASNIKIGKQFKQELKPDNYLYFVFHVVPAVIKMGVNALRKLGGKMLISKKGKENMAILEERVNNLTNEELDTLFNEYRGSKLRTDMNLQINSLIDDRLKRYGRELLNNKNKIIKDNYNILFSEYDKIKCIDNKLSDKKIEDNIKEQLKSERKACYEKASEAVINISKNRVEANKLASGGIHGLEEDFKAIDTKMNYKGKRFAKINNFDNNLQHELSHEEKELNKAIDAKDTEGVVNHFMNFEGLYAKNTEVNKSAFGNRSTGSKYYSPLTEELDYREDPFIRDLFTTVATTSAVFSLVNSINTNRILEQQRDSMESINKEANNITSKNDTVIKGAKANAYQDSLNIANTKERSILDKTNWSFNDAYHVGDKQNHAFYNKNFDDINYNVNDIMKKYESGAISQSDALNQFSSITRSSQSTLVDTAKEALTNIGNYSKNHPSIDLHSVKASLQNIVDNPNSVADAYQAVADGAKSAGTIANLSASQVNALASLPNNLGVQLVAASSTFALAANTTSKLSKKISKNAATNEIINMMNERTNANTENTEYKAKAA